MNTEPIKIKIKLENREIELTVDEARDLQQKLNNLFQIETAELEKIEEKMGEYFKPYVYPFQYPSYNPNSIWSWSEYKD